MISAYRSTYNEYPFFLSSNPLDYFVGALGESVSAGAGTGHAVELEQRCDPSQGYGIAAYAMVDFEVGIFGVNIRMEGVV